MKICLINTLYYPYQLGGAEKSVQIIAEGLKSIGYESFLVCTANKDYIEYVNGVKVYYVNTNNIYWSYNAKERNKLLKPVWHFIDANNFFIRDKIDTIIKTENPDIIHTNNLAGFSDIVWVIAKKHNKKIVHTLRDYYQLCPKSTMFKKNQNCIAQCISCKILSIPKKKNSGFVDAVVGVSDFILKKHLNFGYFNNAKIKTNIFNPIYLPKKISKTKSKNIRFGLVGIISSSKGTAYICEKFIRIKNKHLELNVYGRGESIAYKKLLEKRFNKKNVTFHGYKKNSEIYNNIDILIVPSLWNEPFGRIVPEANSYGIPVLASKKGGLPELIINGKNGFIFDPDRDCDFEEKLKLIIGMYKDYIFEFELDNFNARVITKKYLNIYNKV